VILLLALVAGLLAGLAWARWHGQPYQPPELQHLWLVFLAFLPQFIVIYLPITRRLFPDWLVVGLLLASQIFLLVFVWLNRRLMGMSIMLCGVVLNILVMTANGGFMPISPQTASRLVSQNGLRDVEPGSRFGTKDILMRPEVTRFEWLADRNLLPRWFPYQVAFSLGDVFIALGAFWLLAQPTSTFQFAKQLIDNRGISI
jgi:multisubunit Na+/H+ antiporter MnhC subunit